MIAAWKLDLEGADEDIDEDIVKTGLERVMLRLWHGPMTLTLVATLALTALTLMYLTYALG